MIWPHVQEIGLMRMCSLLLALTKADQAESSPVSKAKMTPLAGSATHSTLLLEVWFDCILLSVNGLA